MTEVNETPWADGERAELVSKLTAAIDADPASEEFKTLFLKVLEAHSEREASLLKALEAAKVLLQQGEPEGALRKAYNKIEQHMFDYTHETHSYDASTNAWECSNGEVVAYVEGLDKALEIIKPLLSATPLPPAPGAETGERKDHLADLVGRFSVALLEKLRAAEKKYGYDNGWLYDDWAYDLRRDLRKHIDKGDPLDVAAYCAFAWHHGWSTSSSGTSYRRAVLEEAAKLVKSFWITAEYDHIGDANVLESVCAQASEAILALATPPAEGETK